MGPMDIQSETWYLTKVRLRTWDHFPVIVKIEVRDLRTKKGVNPRSEVEESKFKELVLRPVDDRTDENDAVAA